MTHEQAVAASLVEKYLLDELTPAEREQFEEHYFECTICADDVLSGYRLKEALQVQASHPQTVKPKVVEMPQTPPAGRQYSEARPARKWAAIAAGALLCVVGYQNLVERPHLQQSMQVATSPYVARAVEFRMGSRAGEATIPAFPAAEPLVLNIDVPAEARWHDYELRVSGPSHPSPVVITSDLAKDTVPIAFPKGSLKPGSYRMQVFGRAIGGSAQLLQEGEFRID